jgi:ABC-type glycerol-3-phosphate transport system permease component
VALAGALIVVTTVAPLAWVAFSSLKPGHETLASPWSLPSRLAWENYANAWGKAGIGSGFVSSLVVCSASLLILVPVGAMAAYVLSKYRFPGHRAVHTGFLGGLMFPHLLVIVPLFLLLRDLKAVDTQWGLVAVYVAYSLSFTIFVLGGFFDALPDELIEAAMIDGCGHSGTFWRVMLPLVRPGLAVVGIFAGIGLWNEYALAKVILTSPETQTLPVGLANLTMTQQYQSDWGALFAGLVIVMLPVLLVYAVFRDRVQQAMVAGAVKG